MDLTPPLYPARPLERPGPFSLFMNRAWNVLLVVGLGVLLAMQYVDPNKRFLSVAAAVIVIGIAWRIDMISGIGVMILALPYPRGTTFGSTNLALILLLAVIYLLRMAQRNVEAPKPTPLDAPIAAFFLAYVVSFYNISSQHDLYFAMENFVLLVGTLLMFFLVLNSIRTEQDLKRLHLFQTIAILSIMLIALWELNHPGATLVPGWINFSNTHGDEFNRKGVRVGATFNDYELLADFCGLNLLFLAFMFMRGRNVYHRAFFGGLMALTLFILFCTVTRGPIVSLSIAVLYMVWLMRRHLSVVPMTIATTAVLGGFFGMNFFVSRFTRSGDLLSRVAGTTFVGWMPETRVGTWTDAWGRMLQHPLIGWGPYYSAARGLKLWFWPHNLYLYIGNLTGFIGLSFFLWLLWTMWRMTTPRVDTPASPNYTESYLFIAHVQLMFFLVDQFKIEYLRNNTYQYQVWLMFAMWAAAHRVQNQRAKSSLLRA